MKQWLSFAIFVGSANAKRGLNSPVLLLRGILGEMILEQHF
jgi:hypothetical protein